MEKYASTYWKTKKIILSILCFLSISLLTERQLHDIISVHSATVRKNNGGNSRFYGEKALPKVGFGSGKRFVRGCGAYQREKAKTQYIDREKNYVPGKKERWSGSRI